MEVIFVEGGEALIIHVHSFVAFVKLVLLLLLSCEGSFAASDDVCGLTVALRFRRALRASVLYGTEARKAQKIIGDTVASARDRRGLGLAKQ